MIVGVTNQFVVLDNGIPNKIVLGSKIKPNK